MQAHALSVSATGTPSILVAASWSLSGKACHQCQHSCMGPCELSSKAPGTTATCTWNRVCDVSSCPTNPLVCFSNAKLAVNELLRKPASHPAKRHLAYSPRQRLKQVQHSCNDHAVVVAATVACRKRYQARFQTEVHSELLGRLCLGNVVVDREVISGLPDDQGRTADCLATYHCEGGKIKKMSFVWQPRQQ